MIGAFGPPALAGQRSTAVAVTRSRSASGTRLGRRALRHPGREAPSGSAPVHHAPSGLRVSRRRRRRRRPAHEGPLHARLAACRSACPRNPTWRENPFHDDNWLFNYHSLRFVLKLEAAWAETGKPALPRPGAVPAPATGLADNPRAAPRSRFSWDDHATAWRAMVYACTAEIVPMSAWLDAALVLHGTVLADARFFVRHGNHALNQSIGLLESAASCTGRAGSSLAADRIDAAGRRERRHRRAWRTSSRSATSTTTTAATRPPSDRLRGLRPARSRRSSPGSTGCRRSSAGRRFRTAQYEQIGDTDAGARPRRSPARSPSSPRPAGWPGRIRPGRSRPTVAGYAFGRSGWGETRPFADETAFAVRYGPGAAFHGHADGGSLTVYGLGSRLIVGSGKYSYNAGPYPPVLRRPVRPERRDGRRRAVPGLAPRRRSCSGWRRPRRSGSPSRSRATPG